MFDVTKPPDPFSGKPEPVRTDEFCNHSCRIGFDKWLINYPLDCLVVNMQHVLSGSRIVCNPNVC